MSSFVLFQQLLILLAFMITGFIAFRTKLVDENTHAHLSLLMVWILNPFLMISGVVGKNMNISGGLVLQNIAMVGGMYFVLFLLGFVYVFVTGKKSPESYLYRLETLFPNVGFMGVPLVKEIFGSEYIIYVAFYMLGFNVICYTYGVYLASKYGGNKGIFDLKKLLNPGVATSLMSIAIFALHLELPAPVVSYVDYLGNTTIPLSMMIIGVSLARQDWKKAFSKSDYYIFALARMLVFPVLLIFLTRFIPVDPVVKGVFQIMVAMPVASMTSMFAQTYGGDGTESANIIALTTICTVVTAPLAILIAG